jgi:hypothetical protein
MMTRLNLNGHISYSHESGCIYNHKNMCTTYSYYLKNPR